MRRNTALFSIVCAILLFFVSAITQAQSNVVITEIMYNDPGSGLDSLEFIEVYNKGINSINLSGYTFADGVDFTFPPVGLAAGDYIVIASDSVKLEAFFGVTALQWTGGGLNNGGEEIVLKTAAGFVIDSVSYNDSGGWPVEADGGGPSLVLCDPDSDNLDPANWALSVTPAGMYQGVAVFASPGAGDCDAPIVDIFPPALEGVSMSSANTLELTFSEPMNGNVTNGSNYTGLDVAGGVIFGNAVSLTLDTPLEIGVYYTLTIGEITDTAGNVLENAPLSVEVVFNNTVAPIAITEFMYNQPGLDTLEFIELYHYGNVSAQLGGYRFASGINYTFPTMTMMPGDYMVLALNEAAVDAFFGIDAVEWGSGSLNNSGETLEIVNTLGDMIDFIDYIDGNPWPIEPDGTGPSVEICDPTADNSNGLNWQAAVNMAGIFAGDTIWASPGRANCQPTGIESRAASAEISLYPNPSSGLFTLSMTENRTLSVSVFNHIGQVVVQKTMDGQPTTIDLVNMPSGVYVVQVSSEQNGKRWTQKVVKY